jgi:uncharacterized protein YfdQ (DUF2303 family)
MERRSEADAVAELATQNVSPIIDPFKSPDLKDSTPIVVWPRTGKIESIERYLITPLRRRAVATVRDTASFIAYVNRFKAPNTMLFCETDDDTGSFTAFIDYHGPEGADWCEHRCNFILELAPEWKKWAGSNTLAMNQETFARFLEDNRLDIIDPKAADIIEMAQSIEATTSGRFKSAQRLQNGDREFAYESTTTVGVRGSLTLPEKLTIQIPVFMKGPSYSVEAWFRYRIKEGTLVLFYELIRPHKVIEAALDAMRAEVAAGTGLPILTGTTLPLPIPA